MSADQKFYVGDMVYDRQYGEGEVIQDDFNNCRQYRVCFVRSGKAIYRWCRQEDLT